MLHKVQVLYIVEAFEFQFQLCMYNICFPWVGMFSPSFKQTHPLFQFLYEEVFLNSLSSINHSREEYQVR